MSVTPVMGKEVKFTDGAGAEFFGKVSDLSYLESNGIVGVQTENGDVWNVEAIRIEEP